MFVELNSSDLADEVVCLTLTAGMVHRDVAPAGDKNSAAGRVL